MLSDVSVNEKSYLRIALVTCLTFSALLLGINFWLLHENAQLRLHNANLSSADGPVIGSHISTLQGSDLSKRPITLDLAHRNSPTLLLVFSPTCPYCRKNLPNWLNVLNDSPAANVVYVDLTGSVTPAYFSQTKLPLRGIPIHLLAEEGILHNLKVTPTTVVVDRNGIVKGSWAGVLSLSQQIELERLLKTS